MLLSNNIANCCHVVVDAQKTLFSMIIDKDFHLNFTHFYRAKTTPLTSLNVHDVMTGSIIVIGRKEQINAGVVSLSKSAKEWKREMHWFSQSDRKRMEINLVWSVWLAAVKPRGFVYRKKKKKKKSDNRTMICHHYFHSLSSEQIETSSSLKTPDERQWDWDWEREKRKRWSNLIRDSRLLQRRFPSGYCAMSSNERWQVEMHTHTHTSLHLIVRSLGYSRPAPMALTVCRERFTVVYRSMH